MIVDCVLLLPKSASVGASFQRRLWKEDACNSNNIRLWHCDRETPGSVWRGLMPILWDSSKRTAKRALQAQFQLVGQKKMEHSVPCLQSNELVEVEDVEEDASPRQESVALLLNEFQDEVYHRRLRWTVSDTKQKVQGNKRTGTAPIYRLVILIQPPSTTYYHTFFTRSLIAWELTLILYQSMAAWISTLGGGYFFCRHLGTAVILAKQQRNIALLMGDYSMAYKCTINEAYSYIYAGQFAIALRTIDSIDALHQRLEGKPNLDKTIANMCQSARVFCMRVQKASKKIHRSSKQQPARTVDDLQRIRVIQ